jgi:toxin-antitoxin system PIN domain toxin
LVKLLDTNILIALSRPEHVTHDKVKRWFKELGADAWATCALTESGFVRIVTNPAFFNPAPDVPDATALLAGLTDRPGHRFWGIDLNFRTAAELFGNRVVGHQQVTDAYLLALAVSKKGQLVTLDRGIKALAGPDYAGHVVVL